jgi:hypothetical protein
MKIYQEKKVNNTVMNNKIGIGAAHLLIGS